MADDVWTIEKSSGLFNPEHGEASAGHQPSCAFGRGCFPMTDDVWTIKAALEWTQGYLARKGDENPRLSAEWLLAEATGLRRVELYVNFERPLSMEERDILRGYVSRRGAVSRCNTSLARSRSAISR